MVQRHVYDLMQSAFQNLEEPEAMTRVIHDAFDLADDTYDIIEDRLLPAAREGKIKKETVERLTALLAAPTIDKLRAFNAEVEPVYEEKEKGGVEFRRKFSKFLQTKAGQLVSALTLGFGFIIAVSILYALAVGTDVATFFRDNPALIIGSGVALSVGLLALLRK
jgi:hypothetical protein